MKRQSLNKNIELLKVQIYAESLNTATYTLIASLLSLSFMILFFYFGLLFQNLIALDVVGLVWFFFLAFLPLVFAFIRIRQHNRKIKNIQSLLDMIEQGKKLSKVEELTKDIF